MSELNDLLAEVPQEEITKSEKSQKLYEQLVEYHAHTRDPEWEVYNILLEIKEYSDCEIINHAFNIADIEVNK